MSHSTDPLLTILESAPRKDIVRVDQPMAPILVTEAPDRAGWIYEIKWDGYRILAEAGDGMPELYTRRGYSYAQRFQTVANNLRNLKRRCLLDGEMVVVNGSGKAEFKKLRHYKANHGDTLVYYVFDLLHLDGHDLTGLPLIERKRLLRWIVSDLDNVKLVDCVTDHGAVFFDLICQHDLEGMVAKDPNSRYASGKNHRSWLKVKNPNYSGTDRGSNW